MLLGDQKGNVQTFSEAYKLLGLSTERALDPSGVFSRLHSSTVAAKIFDHVLGKFRDLERTGCSVALFSFVSSENSAQVFARKFSSARETILSLVLPRSFVRRAKQKKKEEASQKFRIHFQ